MQLNAVLQCHDQHSTTTTAATWAATAQDEESDVLHTVTHRRWIKLTCACKHILQPAVAH
jgi:nitrate reductase cytochrome c-type subunit